jgi:hypothetical protein
MLAWNDTGMTVSFIRRRPTAISHLDESHARLGRNARPLCDSELRYSLQAGRKACLMVATSG